MSSAPGANGRSARGEGPGGRLQASPEAGNSSAERSLQWNSVLLAAFTKGSLAARPARPSPSPSAAGAGGSIVVIVVAEFPLDRRRGGSPPSPPATGSSSPWPWQQRDFLHLVLRQRKLITRQSRIKTGCGQRQRDCDRRYVTRSFQPVQTLLERLPDICDVG